MFIGEKIKNYREIFKLSQEQLAEELETSRQTISSWENDKTYPNLRAIIILSKLFDTSIENLIEEDIYMMKEELREKQNAAIKQKKERDVLNRLNALRLFNGAFGALILFPVWQYCEPIYLAVPIGMLLIAMLLTIPIERYRKKYQLKKYADIVAFFDEKYH